MNYVTLVDTDIDTELLSDEIMAVIKDYELENDSQISVTSISGDDDWFCSVGKIWNLSQPERFYSKLNKSFKGGYVEELLSRYKKYYRWRLMKLEPRHTYSVHADGDGKQSNIRLHIPIITNHHSYLCFFNERVRPGKDIKVRYEQLEAGNSYEVNTTRLHTAVNYGVTDRYHLVGVRYESSDNGP